MIADSARGFAHALATGGLRRPSALEKGQNGKNEERDEEDFRNPGGGPGDSRESQNGCDDCNN